MVAHAMDYEHLEIAEDKTRMRPWEIWHLQSDNTKIYQIIHRRPQVSFTEALDRTVNYFKAQNCRWAWEKQ
jgi:hypothetical protein